MPRMTPLSEIEVLFFQAKKVFLNPPAKYFVEGYPNSTYSKEYFKEHERDFFFRTYKEVIVAGIYWAKRLFGSTNIQDIYIKHLEFGRKKQWFNVQLVQTGNGVIIDGEKFNPYVNVSYSYNTVTKVKFEIGFYRAVCSNGMVSGFKELSKMEIKPENLFDIPFWLNPCLIKFLTQRFEIQLRILKSTSLKGEEIQNWIHKNVTKWNISREMIFRNIEHGGENAFGLLNILTDSASNFERDIPEVLFLDRNIHDDQSSNSERALRQRKVGQFLETLVEQIMSENQIESSIIDINSPDFKLNDESFDLLDTLKVKKEYKLDIGKLKF